MPDANIESILLHYRPLGPGPMLRQIILAPAPGKIRHWALYTFRSAIAASLLISLLLLHAAGNLDRAAAQAAGTAPSRWTPEAQQVAELLGPSGKTYVALCLRANAESSEYPSEQSVRIP